MTTLSSVSSNQASPDGSAALFETRSVFLDDEAATVAFGYKLAQSTQRRAAGGLSTCKEISARERPR